MFNITQISVNIAMESTALLVTMVLLIILIWQRNLYITTKPLMFLSSFIVIQLVVQIVMWYLYIIEVPVRYGEMPMRIVYFLDYVFNYLISVAFYYYVEAIVIDSYKGKGLTYEPNNKVQATIKIWGVVSTLVYVFMLFTPAIYHLEQGEIARSMVGAVAYLSMHIMIKYAYICAIVLIIRHKKVIGRHETVLSVFFVTLISVFVIFDELLGFCVNYVLMVLWVFILYVRIDLHKGLLIERQEKEIIQWKTQIMLSQMQPHFLYNVLTTISSLCEMENASHARDVVNQFADYLRINLDSLGKDRTISFEKELEHIKTYLCLEKIRFEDELNICYEIGVTDFEVPSLSIQPMVENAVKHGILPKDNVGTVTIRTYETKLDYVIVVEDDGVGFDLDEQKNASKTHIGIENVSKRLEVISNGSCEIKSEKGKGTVVTIHIPKGEMA